MEISQELWDIIKRSTVYINSDKNYMLRLEKTNNKFKELGMNTRAEPYFDNDAGDSFYCRYDDNDASLFDINFFYLFLKIFLCKDYIFYFEDGYFIDSINNYFTKRGLPYTIRFKNNELKLYEVTLKEVPLKL